MKLKRCFYALLAAIFGLTLVACNNGDNTGNQFSKPMQVYVGTESVLYYQDILDAYVAEKNLPFTIEVTGTDTGSYANTFLQDTKKGADIFVTAHDNLGKLLDGAGTIAPVTSKKLTTQMEDNTDSVFLRACFLSQGGSQPAYYAVPLIRQSLVLYYDKSAFAGNEAALENWDTILEVAASQNKMATTYMGTDGYSYSHWLLAQPADAKTKAAFGENGTLELFADGQIEKNYAWGADQVLIHKYASAFTNNPAGRNGQITSASWEGELSTGKVVTLIGGAWSLKSVQNAFGKSNYGVTVLPKFTVDGYTFQSGSFYDVKCLVKKKDSAYADYLDEILLLLSSNEVQGGSYLECANLPASNNAVDPATGEKVVYDALAQAQINQGQSAGLPQPFGVKPTYNPAYYSTGTDKLFIALHETANPTDADIKAALQKISYYWAHNGAPVNEADIQTWVNGYGK